jgi:hypothetical protein
VGDDIEVEVCTEVHAILPGSGYAGSVTSASIALKA